MPVVWALFLDIASCKEGINLLAAGPYPHGSVYAGGEATVGAWIYHSRADLLLLRSRYFLFQAGYITMNSKCI